MLNQQIITEWIALKEKITNLIKDLKAQAQQNNHSQLNELEQQLQAKNQAIKDKEREIYDLEQDGIKTISDGSSPEIIFEEFSKKITLREELQQLIIERQTLLNKLNKLFPLRNELVKLNRLYSLEQSLQQRESENKDYLARIERAETNWNASEKKLDLIRDLLGTKQLNKLISLYKKGQI